MSQHSISKEPRSLLLDWFFQTSYEVKLNLNVRELYNRQENIIPQSNNSGSAILVNRLTQIMEYNAKTRGKETQVNLVADRYSPIDICFVVERVMDITPIICSSK